MKRTPGKELKEEVHLALIQHVKSIPVQDWQNCPLPHICLLENSPNQY